jgi:hypothetical protein
VKCIDEKSLLKLFFNDIFDSKDFISKGVAENPLKSGQCN